MRTDKPSPLLCSCDSFSNAFNSAPHSGRSELTSGDLSHEQQQIIQERQLEQDIRQTIQWIDKMEVTSTTLWSCPPLSADYDNVIRQCKQYNVSFSDLSGFRLQLYF